MKVVAGFFKWLMIFILAVVAIVCGHMAYDYIKLYYFSEALEEEFGELETYGNYQQYEIVVDKY